MKRLKYLYHATPRENVESILESGLIPDFKSAGVTGGRKLDGVIELDSELKGLRKWLKKHGYIKRDWAMLRIDAQCLDRSKLERSKFYIKYSGGEKESFYWYTYKGVIPP